MKAVLVAITCLLLAPSLIASRVEIVLDVSGSMRASAGSVSRMDAARQAVKATVDAIGADSNVALRLYGHRLPAEPKDASCRDTELVIPFGPLDRQRFVSAVDAAKPLGQTPLAYALEQAAADFGAIGDEPVAVILVSDGEESCGGDPAKVACAFRERGLDLTVHTVGFDVGAAAREQLKAIASCTGGEYRDARNAGELADSLRQLTQAGLLIDKERETRGNVVRGGNGFDSAVKLTPGTYRLDHHQRPNEFDYFTVDVEPGHIVLVRQIAFEVGIEVKGDTFRETSEYQFVAVALHAPDKSKIGANRNWGAGKKAEVGGSVRAGQGGAYYVVIGGEPLFPTHGTHKDAAFTIEIMDVSDAASGTDAGDGDRDAVRIAVGRHDAWFQPADQQDTFWFDGEAGATYSVVVRPDVKLPQMEMTVSDEDRVNFAKVRAANDGAALRADEIRPTRSGKVYVAVSYLLGARLEKDPARYSLEIVQTGKPPEAAGAKPAKDDAAAGGSLIEKVPGGWLTCGALAFLAIVGGVVVGLLLIVLKRRSKG